MPSQSSERGEGPGAAIAALRPGIALLGFPAYIVDAQQRYVLVNEAYESYFGRRADTMEGRTVAEIFGPPHPDGRREVLLRALAGETLTFDREARHGANAGRWLRVHYMPIRD